MTPRFQGGGTPTERGAGHLESAVMAVVIQAVVGAFGKALDNLQTVQETGTVKAMFALMGSAPGIFTLVGWAMAIILGGPLGILGFPIGAIGGEPVHAS